MKNYDEIRDIIVNKLGIKDLASYEAWIKSFHDKDNPRVPTQEDIDLLSPDLIDNGAFWQVAHDLFSTDPVSNCQHKDPVSILEANNRNMTIYHSCGFTGLIWYLKYHWKHMSRGHPHPLLEIGPGYGGFRDWLWNQGGFEHYGADVFPLIDGVEHTLPTGTLSPTTKGRRYSIVLSSNVFQHLSTTQRRAYYKDIFDCMYPGGFFMFNLTVDYYEPDAKHRDSNGRVWMRHYGQFTEIQKPEAVYQDLKDVGFQLVRRDIQEERWLTLTYYKPFPVSPEPVSQEVSQVSS